MDTLKFNNNPSYIMHIDLNSCFATIEQQANPLLRGKPIVVAAYTSPGGCILAASIEAKKLGIKTGMRVRDGRAIYKNLIVLSPDPQKYRNIHIKLRNLIADYTSDFVPKSIDEFVLNLENYIHTYKEHPCTSMQSMQSMQNVAIEIKRRIKEEIGEWLTVSIGIAPNRYLAKIAAGLHKPDGLDEINCQNFLNIYSTLKLTDLTGIKSANVARLNSVGIYTVLDFYRAPVWKLKAAFHSITGLYWHTRLAGYEADSVEYQRRSYGNSVALGKNLSTISDLSPVLARLTEKACSRLRRAGYTAGGIHLFLAYKPNQNPVGGLASSAYKNGSWWHKSRAIGKQMFDSRDLYRAIFRLLIEANPSSPVLNVAVSFFNLTRESSPGRRKPLQLEFFEGVPEKRDLVNTIDAVNRRWGEFTLGSARGFEGTKIVQDRIAFGGIKELEEFTIA